MEVYLTILQLFPIRSCKNTVKTPIYGIYEVKISVHTHTVHTHNHMHITIHIQTPNSKIH